MNENTAQIAKSDEKEYETTDQGFAAYLATQFMFLGAIDTGQVITTTASTSRPKLTRKSFLFIVPHDEDMEEHVLAYSRGDESTRVPAKVMFAKVRLMRQACQKPFNPAEA